MFSKYIEKNGIMVPKMAFGTWKLQGAVCEDAVYYALQAGYEHIDTADSYGNHPDVVKAIKRAGKRRDELFITTKVQRDDLEPGRIKQKVEEFLDELKTDYIDLLLIHWPNKEIPVNETLAQMQEFKDKGKVKLLGVSNFTINHIKDVLKTGIKISFNQVEFHPSLYQKELKRYCEANNIHIEAYSPIAQGEDMNLDTVQELALKYEKTPAQIILNWLMHIDTVVLPRSKSLGHIQENFESINFVMHDEDYAKLENLDTGNRILIPKKNEFDY